MTEQPQPRRAARRGASSRPTTIKITAVSVAAAAALTAGLAGQMASGHDPALGSGHKASAARVTEKRLAQPGAAANAAPPPASVVTRAS